MPILLKYLGTTMEMATWGMLFSLILSVILANIRVFKVPVLDQLSQLYIKTYDTGIEHDVALGRADAFVMDRLSVLETIEKTGLPLQLAGKPFETIENAWPFLNNEKGQKLQAEVNEALAAIRADGTLSTISNKWFGTDITN